MFSLQVCCGIQARVHVLTFLLFAFLFPQITIRVTLANPREVLLT